MKKLKIGVSFFALVIVCVITHKIVLLINYFSALIIHELAHLFVAKNKGYNLKQIRLDIFGLSIALKEDVEHKDEFAVNVAGPLCNLIMCLICCSLYYFFPITTKVLNEFCLSNFALAAFNFLPIYPLDGGKIFYGLIKSDKLYNVLDKIIRYSFVTVFAVLFVVSCFSNANFMLLVMVIFFLTSGKKRTPTFSIFKFSKKTQLKIRLVKIKEDMDILTLVKFLKKSTYTIFYCNTLSKKFIDEDEWIEISLSHKLNTKLKDVEIFT